MKVLSRTFGRVVRTSLALALALPAFAAQPAPALIAASTIGFEADNAITLPNDHTPFAFRIKPTGFASLGVYRVKMRFMQSTTPSDTADRGFIWNKATNQWVAFDAPWSEMPTITMDASGQIVGGNDAWLWAKYGDERTPARSVYQQIALQDVATSLVTTGATQPQLRLLDMDADGAWVHSINATTTTDERAEVTGTVSPWSVIALSKTEPNLVDTDSNGTVDDGSENIGHTSLNGDYRMAVPAGQTNAIIFVNRTNVTSSWIWDFTGGPADTDVAENAGDETPPAAPLALTTVSHVNSITVSWTAPADLDIDRYLVYRWVNAPAGAKYTPVKTLIASPTATSYTDTTTVEGTQYNYEVRTIDTYTNVSARAATTGTPLDTIKPTVTPTPMGNDSARYFSIAATDGATGSGIASISYRYDAGPTTTSTVANPLVTSVVTTVGAHALYYTARDVTGNETTGSVAFSVATDLVKPVVTAALVGTNTANASFAIAATDAGIGVAGLQYKVSPTPGTTTTVAGPGFAANLPITVPGSYTASWWAIDLANNITTGTLNFAVVSSDIVAPVTSISAIPSGWSQQSITVTLTAFEASSGPATTFFRLDGGATSTYTTAVPITTDGTHTLEYWSVDQAWPANKETTKTATIRIDRTNPILSVVGGSATGTVTVTAAASDAASGIQWTRYRVGAGAWTTGTAVSISAPGTSVVDFETSDNAGNITAASANAIVSEQPVLTRRATSSITFGTRAMVTGVLSAPTISTEGVPVRLEYLNGATWTPYPGASAITGPGGAYSLSFKPNRKLRLRVAFAGAGALAPALSPEYTITVRASINLRSVATQRANRTFSVYATLAPAHASYVYFRVYKKVGSKYRIYRTYKVKSGMTFRARVKLPAGLYRVQASHGDAAHYPNVSTNRYFRVR